MAWTLDYSSGVGDSDKRISGTNMKGKITQFRVICNDTPPPRFLLCQPNGIFPVVITHCFHVHRFRKEMPKSPALAGTLLAGSVAALALADSGREI